MSMLTPGGQNFTRKAQEALLMAQDIARERGQQQIDALHLLYVLLSQEESVILNLLQKMGVDIRALKRDVKIALDKIPIIATPQTFGQFYLTQDMAKVLDKARQEAMKLRDEFISVEHFFLALLSTQTKAKEILDKARFIYPGGSTGTLEYGNLNYQNFLKQLSLLRGGRRDNCFRKF